MAKAEYDRALTLTEEMAKADPDRVINDRYLGLHNYRLGCLEDALGNTNEAEEYFKKSLAHHRKVFDIDNSNERRHAELMLALSRTASVTEAIEIADAFAARPNLDSEMLVDVARCYAQCSRNAGQREKELVLKAREMLARARAQGFADEFWLRNELDLKPLFSKATAS
jgi:tetratricopeptide (TPR) repeat protein